MKCAQGAESHANYTVDHEMARRSHKDEAKVGTMCEKTSHAFSLISIDGAKHQHHTVITVLLHYLYAISLRFATSGG